MYGILEILKMSFLAEKCFQSEQQMLLQIVFDKNTAVSQHAVSNIKGWIVHNMIQNMKLYNEL